MNSFSDRLRIAGAAPVSGKPRRFVAAALCALALGIPAAAEDIRLPITAGTEPAGAFETDAGQAFELSLNDVIVHALRHNVSLVVERYSRSQSLLGIQEALGIYDFNLNGTLERTNSTRPSVSQLEQADIISSDRDVWNFSLNRLLTSGGTAEVRFNNSRTATSNPADQPNPGYIVGLNFGLTQPLLRNRGREVTERNLVVARNNASINREAFRTQVEGVIQQVSDVYWDLVGAKEQLKVAEESLDLAKELHEMNRIQVDVGTKAPLEMVQSEAGVARREEDIIRRRQTVEDSEDQLRRQINFARGRLWEVPLVPITPPEIEHHKIDVASEVDAAYEMRPDVERLRLQNRTRELDARVAKNALLPRLDLTAGFGYSAVAGLIDTLNPQTGEGVFVDTNYFDGLDSIADREFDGWELSLNFSMPLENRVAKAGHARAKLAVKQGEYELEDLYGQVRLEVRRTARAVETAAKSIESAKVSSHLARKNLDAERKRYENGLSTSFQVLEIQEDLSQARSSEVAAIIGYRKALTAFHQATGKLLEQYRIQLEDEDPEAPRPPRELKDCSEVTGPTPCRPSASE